MGKRSDTTETVLLALELLRRIPRVRKISAKELHEQLIDAGINRDLRTIQRQLKMLSDHFDIEMDDQSKPFGYRWKERSRGLEIAYLTPKESLFLSLAEQHLSALLPENLKKSMRALFNQAQSNLGPTNTDAKKERSWLSKVRVVDTSPSPPPKIIPEVLSAVSEALFGDFWLDIEYEVPE